MGEMRARRWAVCVWLLLPSSACYRHVPTAMEAAAVGSEVRVAISTDAQRALRDQLGVAPGVLEGTVLGRVDDRIFLSVGFTDPIVRRPTDVLYQRIEVASRDVTSLSLRRLHVARTTGLIGAVVAAAIFVGIQALDGGEPGLTLPPREKGAERVQGVFRLKFPSGR